MSTTDGVTSHVSRKQLGVLFLCAVSLSSISCGHTQAAAPVPINTVMQAVHEYGRGHQAVPAAPLMPTVTHAAPAAELYDTDETYKAHLAAIFAQGDFAQLEKEAHEDRASKARLRGGVWKLLVFYEGVSSPAGGTHASDSDWDDHIAAVKKWVIAYPDSATAHVALAETYLNYAWAARGGGYADSVSESGWKLFGKRVALAESTLVEAAKLKEKCPYWYEAMQQVALAQGWQKEQARELLDQAAAFEPTYYHFYREYANFLLPKWHGEEGETQAFAEEISARLGDPDGSIVYFEIASLLACQCDAERDSLAGMSWPRVKQGYADLQRLYGTSDLKMNRFAYMSYVAGDKSSANDTFAMLGDSWNRLVWRSAENFTSAKEWASTP
jgi:hypothetical protein